MEFQFLTNIPIRTVQSCMLESFADYQIDMSYMTVEVMEHRNTICRNNPDYSVGAFDGDKMIGFINVGLDYINNELTAFDGGTGVIKSYRGKGIAGKMFAKSVEHLNKKGVKNFMLEVLQPNTSAIKAYKKEGFVVSRSLKCYDIEINNFKGNYMNLHDVKIKQISVLELEKYWHYIKYPVSWEHMLSGLKAFGDKIIIHAAFNKDVCEGFIVYNPVLCWITAIGLNACFEKKDTLVDYLIGNLIINIHPPRPKISVNNLMEEDSLNEILIRLGFENPVDQYEMIKDLTTK